MGSVYSAEITNIKTVPTVKNAGAVSGGTVRAKTGTKALLTTDIDSGDIIFMCEVPMHARILSIKIFNDDLDTGGTGLQADVGLYTTAEVALDSNVYCSGSTLLTAINTTGTEVAFQTRNITAIKNHVWQDAGLTADTGDSAWIAITISQVATTAGAGDVSWIVTYTD